MTTATRFRSKLALAGALVLGVAAMAAARAPRGPIGNDGARAAAADATVEAAAAGFGFREIVAAGGDSALAVVRLAPRAGESEIASLDAFGIRVLSPLPGRRHVARLSGPALRLAAAGDLPHALVAEARRPHAAERADARVLSGTFDAFARTPDGRVALYASVAGDVALDAAAAEAATSGARVVGRVKSLHLIVLEAPESAVASILRRDGTFLRLVQASPALSPCNDGVRAAMGVPTLADPPLELTGAGIRVLVFDQGLASGVHPDLAGRVTAIESGNVTSHATHTAGTIAGNGSIDPSYRGVAPNAEILAASYPSCVPQCLYNNPQDLEEDYESAHVDNGADLNSNSIGANVNSNGYPCEWEGAYETTAALLDAMVAGSLGGTPVLSVWAAGNERQSTRCGSYVTIGVPATAKNVVTVGAVDSGDGSVASFSSFGPTRDGRLKPDVMAPGCQAGGDGGVTSTVPPNGYAALCGTSMAAPAVAGLLALALERYRALHPAEDDPLPATMKALLCHTAVEIGSAGPDFESGFGAADGPALVAAIEAGRFLEGEIDDRAARRFDVVVGAGDPELRVTLAWSDPPATLNAAAQLVNDLDLVLVDPFGTEVRPLVLDPASPGSPAAPGVDRLNPIEQARVSAPAAGQWRVVVMGDTVTSGTQAFGLVSSHSLAETPLRDLAATGLVADYDPTDPDTDSGPGVSGQAADLLGTVTNVGGFPVVAARLRATASIPGGASVSREIDVADFDSGLPGAQPLATGAAFVQRFSFAAGELTAPGTYDLVLESIPGQLVTDVSGSPVMGDEVSFNDALRDFDDRDGNDADDVEPDALDYRTHALGISLPPESQVIEVVATERVRLELHLTGLLASGPRRSTQFRFDLYRASGEPVASDVRPPVSREVKAVIDKSAELRIGLGALVAIPRNVPLEIRVHGFDTALEEMIVCGVSPPFTVLP